MSIECRDGGSSNSLGPRDIANPHSARLPRRFLALILTCLFIVVTAVPGWTDASADKAAISDRLHRWAAAFNARDVAGVCDLFAPDLISTVPEALDAGRDVVCARLAAVLARRDVQFHYSPDIREIVLSGDIAVVRLYWTLTIQRGDDREVGREAGMDIFARQPNGEWSIVRFMAFSIDPNRGGAASPSLSPCNPGWLTCPEGGTRFRPGRCL